MLISTRQNKPTQLGQQEEGVNRRLLKEEKEHRERLAALRETGHNFLKPPGVRKTKAVLAQEACEREMSNDQSFDRTYERPFGLSSLGFERAGLSFYQDRVPDSSFNHSLILDERSFASWQTVEERPQLTRSPAVNFSRLDASEQSFHYDSIYIRMDSSFR